MKISIKFLVLVLMTFLLSCKESNKDIYVALEKFDNSLDSLIVEKTFSNPNMLIFQSDTLHNNPKIIEETYYMFIGKDSVKVDANCSVLRFKNNQFEMNLSEDFLGRKFVQKMIYFDDKIDDELLEQLRSKKSDTIYFGLAYKYNEKGQLLKKLESTIWNNLQKDGSVTANDSRLLEVYNYNDKDNTLTTYRKEYFNKKYNADSLLSIETQTFTQSNTLANDRKSFTYKTDDSGNWIEKRNNAPNSQVYYRKYYY